MTDAPPPALVAQLADRFAATLRAWLTPAQWAAMVEANGRPRLGCASHDYCDANMAMDQAFRDLGLGALLDVEEMADATVDLFNAAWRHAARHQLAPRDRA